jgi:hypothetical protein
VEIILIELLLWAGLIFFFWALRDGLNQAETEMETEKQEPAFEQAISILPSFDRPDRLSEPIGRYRDAQIYRIAFFEGKAYQFQHVLPWESLAFLVTGERCIAPGLVYAMCAD